MHQSVGWFLERAGKGSYEYLLYQKLCQNEPGAILYFGSSGKSGGITVM